MVSDDAITGSIGEKLVCIELLKRKIDFWEMKERNPVFDIIIEQNNCLKKIQVKTSKGLNGYNFSLGNAFKYDYVVLVKMKENPEFFIIPSNKIIENKTDRSKSKYLELKDNWEILQ